MGFSFRLILPEARGKRKPKERKREKEKENNRLLFFGIFYAIIFLVLIFFEYFYKYFILFHVFTQQSGLHTFFPALKLTKFDGIGEVRFSNRS